MGVWNLTQANEIRVKFKNAGDTAVTPSVSFGDNTVAAKDPIAPGAESEVIVPFAAIVSTVFDPDYTKRIMPGTGQKIESEKVKQFTITSDATPGTKSLLITSIVADVAYADLPDWLGKKPPVDGDWTQTFDEEFNGPRDRLLQMEHLRSQLLG